MGTVDLECRQSFSFPPCGAAPCGDCDALHLGRGYQTFLSVEIPPSFGLRALKQARLILFKMPAGDAQCPRECPGAHYFAFPLLDFFSVFGYLYGRPQIDKKRGVIFMDDPHSCCTEIDITPIVCAWMTGAIENKGLLLTGRAHTPPITYASCQNGIAGMRPMLRLVCEDVPICEPLSSVCCTVTVDL